MMKHHSTLPSVSRDGPNAVVRETIPYRKATKNFTQCSPGTKLGEALELLNSSGADFLVATIDGTIRILGPSEIARWLATKAADGIVSLTDVDVEGVLAETAAPPLLSRKKSISAYLSEISKGINRYVVINEDGKPSQKPLAILDALLLLIK